MAAPGPGTARQHGSPPRRPHKGSRAPPPPGTLSQMPDPFYGHEEAARLCAKFVTNLFACPDTPPVSTTHPPVPSPPLGLFIAYALHRTRLNASVTFAALYLLQRLKARFPAARGSSGHRLFISAFMIASKVICDDTYSNKSWSIVGQGMFALREINQMEREMCSYLEWQLNIEPKALQEFEMKVRRDFKGQGPFPNYILPSPAPSPVPSTTPYAQVGSAPTFARPQQQPTSPPKPIPPAVPVAASHATAYLSPPSSPRTPATPGSSRSTFTSPASSASPPTPPGYEDFSAKIVTSGMVGTPLTLQSDSAAIPISRKSYVPAPVPRAKPPKTKTEYFAHASPCIW
ncbi:hypothetical protein SCP_0603290 [Sparassis crispa]|uniref:Cyclin N-terminal domain-containing protein n=1 Tax=Sparassis crispa TaxID=139825 RepID=A0A401GQ42_9APHY|nr:hypothetical protein SCP_0603290 [Sparassis crispa]GBE84351.1 hypothetical protein SCP_0603290 [Sparassis crispa]